MAVHNSELLKAINEISSDLKLLDSKVNEIKEEMLLNRDNMKYVDGLKKTITIDDFKKKMDTVDDLEDIKFKGVGAMTVISFAWAFIFWYITKKLM